uniref:Uncharacterized protein n=1 Tax=Glossina pallidipes TaxID=7398 RepID=A0A1B0AE52_GLOPL
MSFKQTCIEREPAWNRAQRFRNEIGFVSQFATSCTLETAMPITNINIRGPERQADALCLMRSEGRNVLEAKERCQQLLMELKPFALTQVKCGQQMYFNGDRFKSNGKATRSGLTIAHSLYCK